MTVLPPLRDLPFNAALDINNKGDIVGVARESPRCSSQFCGATGSPSISTR